MQRPIQNRNEFKEWPSRFLGEPDGDGEAYSLNGLPLSAFEVKETWEEIHKRLGQEVVMSSPEDEKDYKYYRCETCNARMSFFERHYWPKTKQIICPVCYASLKKEDEIKEAKRLIEELVCPRCGGKLEFAKFDDGIHRVLCVPCGRTVSGVKPDVFSLASRYLIEQGLSLYSIDDDPEEADNANRGKMCEIIGWLRNHDTKEKA